MCPQLTIVYSRIWQATKMLDCITTHTGDTMQVLISVIQNVEGQLVNFGYHWFCFICFISSTAKAYVGYVG
jgi:hypothetical protein